MSDERRVETMAVKLATYVRRAGTDPSSVVAAYQLSSARRLASLRDPFHPDLLHPARTALIMLQDAGRVESDVLTAAALCESEYPALRIPAGEILAAFGTRVHGLVTAVPVPDTAGERLLEELVIAPDDVALIAVAERLDHARHLHFRDRALWPPFFEQIRNVYVPLAGRVSPALQARLTRWLRARTAA